jgi:beta-lactamase class A
VIWLLLLQDPILDAALSRCADEKWSRDRISYTLIDLKSGKTTRHRGDVPYYPASVVKICYMAATFEWEKQGLVKIDDAYAKDLRDMMGVSSNKATQRIVDRLCGTKDGPELSGKDYAEFAEKRHAVNRWLRTLGLKSLNACQKTYDGGDISPRDYQFLRSGKSSGAFTNRNSMTTDETAQLLAMIATGKLASSDRMLELMKRDLKTHPGDKKLTLGGVPEGSKVWAKVGWVSTEAHDAAIVEVPGGRRYVLVTFTTGRNYQGSLIAEIARAAIPR